MIRLLAAAALVGATVYTGEGEPIEGATVVVSGERIVSVGRKVKIPKGADVIEAAGAVITPGLVETTSRLGTVEVSGVSSSVEATGHGGPFGIHASLRAWESFNPDSVVLPVARLGGITSAVVVPGSGLIGGQSAWVDLAGKEPVRRAPVGMHVSLVGRNEAGSRARRLMRLREVLIDARLYRTNRGPYIGRRLRELSISHADLDALVRVVDRKIPLVVTVHRAIDIQNVLALAREERVRVVLVGVTEGWKVADEIKRARVPVIVDPVDNLPSSFDRISARDDNALLLEHAGVTVAFMNGAGPHLAHRLRHAAGHAVALGYPRNEAVAAITRLPAEIFGVDEVGVLRKGAPANLVLWNGDPLETTTWPTRMWINGQEIDLQSRQDLLVERYREVP